MTQLIPKQISFRSSALHFAINTSANFIYSQPALGILEKTVLGYNWDEVAQARMGNALLSLCLGGVYVKFLDYCRERLNSERYLESQGMHVRTPSFKNSILDHSLDIAATAVFWNLALAPVLYFVNNFPAEKIINSSLGYLGFYAVSTPPFGCFLDWYREKARSFLKLN